jgi:hypothetical protein
MSFIINLYLILLISVRKIDVAVALLVKFQGTKLSTYEINSAAD